MSKAHILTSDGRGQYTAVVHVPVPAGNNSAGKAWKTVLLKSGESGATELSVGTGPSDITQSEKNDITVGDVLEFRISVRVESGGATVASVEQMVNSAIVDKKAQLVSQYKYFGFTLS